MTAVFANYRPLAVHRYGSGPSSWFGDHEHYLVMNAMGVNKLLITEIQAAASQRIILITVMYLAQQI
jgi:hypothetical protein